MRCFEAKSAEADTEHSESAALNSKSLPMASSSELP
jgi:hypothetical protein